MNACREGGMLGDESVGLSAGQWYELRLVMLVTL